MENKTLPERLQDPEYRKHYVKYKVWVEHKRIPPSLLKDLPFDVKVELLNLWNMEWKRYLKKRLLT